MAIIQERRRFPRILTHAPLRYQMRGVPDYNNVICDDISLGGLGFINERFLAPDTFLTLEINVLSRILNAVGKIVRSDSLPRSDKYRLGVEFLEITPQEKRYLADYIDMKRENL